MTLFLCRQSDSVKKICLQIKSIKSLVNYYKPCKANKQTSKPKHQVTLKLCRTSISSLSQTESHQKSSADTTRSAENSLRRRSRVNWLQMITNLLKFAINFSNIWLVMMLAFTSSFSGHTSSRIRKINFVWIVIFLRSKRSWKRTFSQFFSRI